jgi:hypothetical protein
VCWDNQRVCLVQHSALPNCNRNQNMQHSAINYNIIQSFRWSVRYSSTPVILQWYGTDKPIADTMDYNLFGLCTLSSILYKIMVWKMDVFLSLGEGVRVNLSYHMTGWEAPSLLGLLERVNLSHHMTEDGWVTGRGKWRENKKIKKVTAGNILTWTHTHHLSLQMALLS